MKTFLALYIGTVTAAERATTPISDELQARGMAAWGDWMGKHAGQMVNPGTPLGRTKKASAAGVADTRNAAVGQVIVQAESHAAAARLFEDHPTSRSSRATRSKSSNVYQCREAIGDL